MTFIDPATGWFEIAFARISQLYNNYWLSRYPCWPIEVVYKNGLEFKKDFQPLIEDFNIKPKCRTVENLHANAPVEQVHQVVHNMICTKDLRNHVFNYINPWGKIHSSMA
jgi:Integrase core domain.